MSDPDRTDRGPSRRSLLRAAAAASGAVALAGCSIDSDGIEVSFGDDSDGGASTDPNGDDSDSGASSDDSGGDGQSDADDSGSSDSVTDDADDPPADSTTDDSSDETEDEPTESEQSDADDESEPDDEPEGDEEAEPDDEPEADDESEPDEPAEIEEDEPAPEPSFSQDCVSVDPDNVTVERDLDHSSMTVKTITRVMDGTTRLLKFDAFSDAQLARDVIQFYGFDRFCFVERPDPPMTYWTVGGVPASFYQRGKDFDEDCISIDHTTITIEEASSGWQVLDGRSTIATVDDESTAQTMKAIIEHFEFTRHCFVSRPDPEMTYWLTD